MGTDVVVREDTPRAMVRLSSEQLQYIANTEFVPKAMRGKLPAILACVAMGRELGLGDMVALNSIHVIDGRASLSAEIMVSIVRGRGHSIVGNFSGDSCTATGKRADNGDEITVTWTRQMAVDAGLTTKNNWKSFPASMLWARAVSQLCRMLFADCFAGGTYTTEEIAEADFEDVSAQEFVALERAEIGGESEGDGAAYGTHPGSVEPESASGTEPLPADTPLATEPQRRLIFAKAKEAGVSTDDLKQILVEFTGQDSSAAIPRDRVEQILMAVEAAGVAL